ncbi:pyrroline-5-carboxylate reductase [Phaeobacter sp. B1627]|uniref:pyrroline-5-carboxylate reductase family protein n=1 Tax=Phaeobacter sp. B1627 TaxID=2583809 RepID=UPI00111ADA41|nr:pyrroline-5-carboxylate reductase dimerization domain-containing protein [Phaeobacter sp. B1627]TNJ47454.1 pyrroline-5-carboxylate reductase [Phaeobacter sp. B1627]
MTGQTLGIIGGAGMLGRAILQATLQSRLLPPSQIWVSCRSGQLDGFDTYPELNVTADNQRLAMACDVVLLCVPPAAAEDLGVSLGGKLVISVMAGVTAERIAALTGATRIVRAMCSPAAATGVAYSPWVATDGVTAGDRDFVGSLFGACGTTDQIRDEAHLDIFTAMTGPVPGFVAFFAESMTQYAVAHGIDSEVADRSVRQLFLGAGQMMASGEATPADHVQGMIDYAGTTAAGLKVLRGSDLRNLIAEGLDATVARCRGMS